MPAEKFYPSTAVEGEPPSELLTIRWGQENAGVAALLEVDGVGGLIALDRSGINRLIKTLRRARDATFGADE